MLGSLDEYQSTNRADQIVVYKIPDPTGMGNVETTGTDEDRTGDSSPIHVLMRVLRN